MLPSAHELALHELRVLATYARIHAAASCSPCGRGVCCSTNMRWFHAVLLRTSRPIISAANSSSCSHCPVSCVSTRGKGVSREMSERCKAYMLKPANLCADVPGGAQAWQQGSAHLGEGSFLWYAAGTVTARRAKGQTGTTQMPFGAREPTQLRSTPFGPAKSPPSTVSHQAHEEHVDTELHNPLSSGAAVQWSLHASHAQDAPASCSTHVAAPTLTTACLCAHAW